LLKLELAGQAAPEITVEDLQGEPVDLAAYQGKVVLVDFWATNCPPCLEEFPALEQLYQQQHALGFEIVGISLDEERALVDEFQTTWRLPWRLGLSSSDSEATRQRYRASKIPSLFVVGRDGKVRYVDIRGEALRRGVESLLAEE
jgi:peroxiredoxin